MSGDELDVAQEDQRDQWDPIGGHQRLTRATIHKPPQIPRRPGFIGPLRRQCLEACGRETKDSLVSRPEGTAPLAGTMETMPTDQVCVWKIHFAPYQIFKSYLLQYHLQNAACSTPIIVDGFKSYRCTEQPARSLPAVSPKFSSSLNLQPFTVLLCITPCKFNFFFHYGTGETGNSMNLRRPMATELP